MKYKIIYGDSVKGQNQNMIFVSEEVSGSMEEVVSEYLSGQKEPDDPASAYTVITQEKFENNFMLRSDIFDNGSAKAKFFLTDYDLQGPKSQDILQTTTIADMMIKNKIGITGLWVNDKKAKAFKYSYTLNNILKNEEKPKPMPQKKKGWSLWQKSSWRRKTTAT